jgi:hypothetical protein
MLPGFILEILKLDLLILFFWYAWEFLRVFNGWLFWMALVSAGAALVFCAWLGIQEYQADRDPKNTDIADRGSVLPFLLLAAIPFAIVAVCTVLDLAPGVFHSSGLLTWTAEQTHRLVYWSRH